MVKLALPYHLAVLPVVQPEAVIVAVVSEQIAAFGAVGEPIGGQEQSGLVMLKLFLHPSKVAVMV